MNPKNTLQNNELKKSPITTEPKNNDINDIKPYQLVDMKYITKLTGMTNKWFYSLIKNKSFPNPIKLGRASRWRLIDVEQWIERKINH